MHKDSYMKFNRLAFKTMRSRSKLLFFIGILLILLPITYLTLLKPKSVSAEWWNDTWHYRRRITIGNTGSAVSNQKVLVEIDTQTMITNEKLQSDCDDIRFTNNGGKLLRYYLDSAGGACNTVSSDYYVLMETINSGDTEFYLYYDNSTAPDAGEGSQFSESTFSPTSGPSQDSEEIGPGPAAYWKLDEGYGTTAYDSADGDHNGTLYNTPTWQTTGLCKREKCLSFSGGSSEYVSGTENLVKDYPFTISAWIRTDSSTDTIFSLNDQSANNIFWGIEVHSSGYAQLIADNGTSAGGIVGTKIRVDDNRWHYITGVFTSSTSRALYVDGELESTASGSVTYNTGGVIDIWNIGRRGDSTPSNYLDGFIDDVKVYRYARSADEIKSDFATAGAQGSAAVFGARDSRFAEGLIAYWPMDETSGTTVSDFSGNSNNATLTNAQETGTAEADDSTNTVVADDDNTSLTPINDAYNDMLLRITGGGSCAVAVGTERMISDYVYDVTPTRTITVSPSFPAVTDDCTFEIRHQLGGKFGNALYFDGSGDIAVRGNFDPPHQGTVAFWMKTSQLNQRQRIIGGHDAYEIDIESNNRLTNQFFAGGATLDAPTVIQQDTWYHVVATYNFDTNKNQTFINGELDFETTESNDDPGNSLTLNIGNRNGASVNDSFKGVLDDVRIYNRVFSSNEARDLYNWGPGPVGYWSMDEGSGTSTVYDRSGNGNNGTMNGGMTEDDWVQGKFGKALELDGTDDYILVNDSASLSFNYGGSFTFEAWAKVYSNQANDSKVLEKKGGTEAISMDGHLGVGGTTMNFYIRDSNNVIREILGSKTVFDDGTWHHFAGVKDGDVTLFYIDGELDGANTSGGLDGKNDAGNLFIGTSFNGGTRKMEGLIDEVRIYNYARAPDQIREDMNAGHPLGGSPLPSQLGWWKFDEGYGDTANDSGSGGNDGDLAGGTTCPQPGDSACPTWSESGKFGKALDFDTAGSTDDYLGEDMQLVDDYPFSISAWVNTTGNSQTVLSLTDASVADDRYYELAIGVTGDVRAIAKNGGSTETAASSATVDDGNWHHVVGVFNSATDRKVYVDGVQDGSNTNSVTFNSLVDRWNIGRLGDSTPTQYFDGLIDEVKFYNTALSADQVWLDYNQGASAVWGALSTDGTGPASWASSAEYCIPGDPSTCNPPVGEWKLDEQTGSAGNDTSGNNYTGTINGNPLWRYAAKCQAGACLEFDGTDDYVNITDNGTLDLTGSFTLSAWIYPEGWGQSGQGRIIDHGGDAGPADGWALQIGDSVFGCTNTLVLQINNSSAFNRCANDNSISLNTWQHVAVAKDGSGNVTYYVNGIESGTGTSAPNAIAAGVPIRIGLRADDLNRDFKGRIDEVRIYDYERTPAQIAWGYNKGTPVGYWKLDECSGTTANDSGSGGNNGTITIGATGDNTSAGTCGGASDEAWANGNSGKVNASLDFDGTDDYITVTDDSALDISSSFTLSAWVNFDTIPVAGNGYYIIEKGTYDSCSGSCEFNYTFFYWNPSEQGLACGFEGDTGGVDIDWTAVTGQWYHLTCIFDDAGNTTTLYIDGKEVDSISGETNTPTPDNSSLEIGRSTVWANYELDGQIDEVKIFNYALTSQQVKEIYNQGAVSF